MDDNKLDLEHLYVHQYFDGRSIDYNGLANKPQINGVTLVGDLSASELHLADISDVPTKLSELTNDAHYALTSQIPTAVSQLTNDSNYATVSQIPTQVSELTNDSNYATVSQIPTKVSELTNDSNYATVSQIPTDVSDLNNDAGYLNASDFTNDFIITNYHLSQTYSAPMNGIITTLSTAITAILNSLSANEYIALNEVIIPVLGSAHIFNSPLLKKGDTVPTYTIQGCSINTDTLILFNINANKVIRLSLTNSTSTDETETYNSDSSAFSVTFVYTKYRKGIA